MTANRGLASPITSLVKPRLDMPFEFRLIAVTGIGAAAIYKSFHRYVARSSPFWMLPASRPRRTAMLDNLGWRLSWIDRAGGWADWRNASKCGAETRKSYQTIFPVFR